MRFIASTLMSVLVVSAMRLPSDADLQGLKIDYLNVKECDNPVKTGHIIIIDYEGRELLSVVSIVSILYLSV